MANSGRPFPGDLAEDILVRQPVKSLLRLKCVCKNWYEIIKSPDFIREHLKKNRKKAPKILVYDHTAPEDSPDPITVISEGGVLENPPPERVRGMNYLLASVDGLFLLERVIDGNVSLSLWNPATRELRPLPDPNYKLRPYGITQDRRNFGFGLDPVTDDYKVVWCRYFWDEISGLPLYEVYAAVYSCSRDSWRIFQPENYNQTLTYVSDICESLGTGYLNGIYYWLVKPSAASKSRILSFDFGSEEFGVIEGPDPERPFYHVYMYLIFLDDDSIALMNADGGFDYEIWVMIQPGLWNKLLVFQCFTHSEFIMSWIPNTIIYVTKNSRLVSSDVRTGETRRLGFRHPRLRRDYCSTVMEGCSVHVYRESLVTIRGVPDH